MRRMRDTRYCEPTILARAQTEFLRMRKYHAKRLIDTWIRGSACYGSWPSYEILMANEYETELMSQHDMPTQSPPQDTPKNRDNMNPPGIQTLIIDMNKRTSSFPRNHPSGNKSPLQEPSTSCLQPETSTSTHTPLPPFVSILPGPSSIHDQPYTWDQDTPRSLNVSHPWTIKPNPPHPSKYSESTRQGIIPQQTPNTPLITRKFLGNTLYNNGLNMNKNIIDTPTTAGSKLNVDAPNFVPSSRSIRPVTSSVNGKSWCPNQTAPVRPRQHRHPTIVPNTPTILRENPTDSFTTRAYPYPTLQPLPGVPPGWMHNPLTRVPGTGNNNGIEHMSETGKITMANNHAFWITIQKAIDVQNKPLPTPNTDTLEEYQRRCIEWAKHKTMSPQRNNPYRQTE